MIHPKDKHASNPRLQCVVCGKWTRLHRRFPGEDGHRQIFFGGCIYSNGGDHLAAKAGDHDVCEPCCHIACKAIAEKRRVA